MGIFNGVLLASDFDGTLVPSSKIMQEPVYEAIRFFIAEGGRFTVSTGRAHQGFHAYSPDYINAPVLLANGGMAYDYESGQIVLDDGIGDEGIHAMRAIRDALPVVIEFYPFGQPYAIRLNERSEKHFQALKITRRLVDDPEEVPRSWAKCMLFGERDEIAATQHLLASAHPELSYLPTSGNALEIQKRGVHKGSGLLRLCARLGIDPAHAYVIGDGYNDIDMMRVAAGAFTPANGDAYVRAYAQWVVSTCEETAVADAIHLLAARYGG